MAAYGVCRFSTAVELVSEGAVIHKMWLSSNQHAVTPGAGQPDEKQLKISAGALAMLSEI